MSEVLTEKRRTNPLKKSMKHKQRGEEKSSRLASGNRINKKIQTEGKLEMRNLGTQRQASPTECKRWKRDSQALKME